MISAAPGTVLADPLSAAEEVAAHIKASGGEAIANGANVTKDDEVAAMVKAAMDQWGRVDILVNNAGILRDKSFAKMEMADFRLVIDVHLVGSALCTKAVWEIMRDQQYGRIICTSSPSGLHGIFGQANYGAAKAGMIGFMNALHLEGAKYNIKFNLLSPSAKTRMTEDLGIPEQILDQMTPEAITAAMLFLVSEDAPSRAIVSCAGGRLRRINKRGTLCLVENVRTEFVEAKYFHAAYPSDQQTPPNREVKISLRAGIHLKPSRRQKMFTITTPAPARI